MPSSQPSITLRDLHRHLRSSNLRPRRGPQAGMELGWILRNGSAERPAATRAPAPCLEGLLERLTPPTPLLRSPRGLALGREVPLRQGARLRLGPGGQVIYRSGPAEDPSRYVPRARLQLGRFVHDFAATAVRSVFTGLDGHPGDELPAPAVESDGDALLDGWLATQSPDALLLRRAACVLRLSIPLGDGPTARVRLAAAEQLLPTFTALFANSPGPDAASRRVATALRTEAVRPPLVGWNPHEDPATTFATYALGQPVAVRTRDDGTLTRLDGSPTFATWLGEGHPCGHPTMEDWKAHLATLAPLVAPLGHLRVVLTDSLEPRDAFVAATLAHALLVWDDPSRWIEAGGAVREELELAATAGLSHPRPTSRARAVLDRAVAILERRCAAGLAPVHLTEVQRFRREFTDRGRTPGDVRRDRDRSEPPPSNRSAQADL